VNTLRETGEILIGGAEDQASMYYFSSVMKLVEITAIQGDQNSSLAGGKFKNLFIRDAEVGAARFERS